MIRAFEPDPSWPEQYAREVVRIGLVAKRALGRMEHVGSTAVPWLSARPILDVLAFVKDDAQREAARGALEQLGYREAPPSDPARPAVWLAERTPRVCLFLVAPAAPFAVDALLVRDHLRVDRALADAYGALKREVCARPDCDEALYERAKSAFLSSVLRQARVARRG
jgi:GrpB-like predicted nucleotidyltransferase (UPF0157 family)